MSHERHSIDTSSPRLRKKHPKPLVYIIFCQKCFATSFLQTGIRVSELANLRTDDIDFMKPSITVRGKGSVEREIALEKKGIHAEWH
jgi:integrase